MVHGHVGDHQTVDYAKSMWRQSVNNKDDCKTITSKTE